MSALGGVAGRLPDGTFGYLEGMSPEAVEAKGGVGRFAHVGQGSCSLGPLVPALAAAGRGRFRGAACKRPAPPPARALPLHRRPLRPPAPGIANVVAAMTRFMTPAKRTSEEVLPMRTAEVRQGPLLKGFVRCRG